MKLKQAIIVRTDLGMGKGKIAGQVARAAVEAAESIRRYCPEWYYSWLDDDSLQTKIILKVDSEAKLQVMHCLQQPFAPFPAILYCFSIIDLLGALCAGQVANKDPTTGKRIPIHTTTNSKNYMRNYMGYTEQQSDLIIQIFRHKLVHLAQPRPTFSYKNKVIIWEYVHEHTSRHLLIQDLPSDTKYYIKTDWSISIDQKFTIGIMQMMLDIRDSVLRHGCYLDQLETNTNTVLDNFEKTIEVKYLPSPDKFKVISLFHNDEDEKKEKDSGMDLYILKS